MPFTTDHATADQQRGTVRWTLVPARSVAEFSVRNLGVRTVRGTVPFVSAYAEIDAPAAGPVVRRVGAVLDLAAVDTGHARRDADLRKPGLLDLDTHPHLTVEADGPALGAAGGTVDAWLTAKGVTVPVTLDVRPAARRSDGSVTVHLTAVLDRRDVGVRAPSFLIGHEVSIAVTVTLAPPAGSA